MMRAHSLGGHEVEMRGIRAILNAARQGKSSDPVSCGTLTGFAIWARPPVACPDGPADIPIMLATLFLLVLLVDALMSCSIGTAMESSKASNRFDVDTGGLEETHGHEDVHGDGVDAGSGIVASRHPSDRK